MPDAQSDASSDESNDAPDTQSKVTDEKVIDSGLTKGARKLWQEEILVDYTIEVEDEQFKVHKVVMASVSDYFKAMFAGSMVESQTDRVRLHALSPLAVSNMIQFAYTGQFGDKMASAEDMFACAVYFLMAPAIEACSEMLVQELNYNSCFDRLSDFGFHNLRDCIAKTEEYIENNFDDIVSTIDINQMSIQGFVNLIWFWRISEWYLFLRIKEWVDADSENRKDHLNNLMCIIRFGLMKPAELAEIKRMDIYLDSDDYWRGLVDWAEGYHMLPIHLKVLDDTYQTLVKTDEYPVCFTADSETNVFYTLDEEDNWVENTALETPAFRDGVAAVVEVNNFLIVCDQLSEYQQWHVFNPRTFTWSTMAGMSNPRQAFALAHHGDYLYAFGGIEVLDDGSSVVTNKMEKYDFNSNNWSVISCDQPPLPQLQGSSACALDNVIYILGGWQTTHCDDGLYSDQLYCYDPATNTWDTKAPIEKTHPSYKMLAMENYDKGVLLVVSNMFDFQTYRPTKDKWGYSCRQLLVDTQLNWHAAGTVLANRDVLYLLNFLQVDEEAEGEVMYGIRIPAKKSGGCVRWPLNNMWPGDEEYDLGDFPISSVETNGSKRLHFSALLAIPQPSVVRNNRAA